MTTTTRTITVRRDVLAEAKADAAFERERLARRGTLAVNLLSSPGAGKTTLLEATARHLAGRRTMAVLVGDLETDRDAQRLSPLVPTAQLSTGGACHLELPLVRRGLEALGDPQVDFLFIENVGNLVCPSSYDLGEDLRVVLLSVTEGEDKPLKYPTIFNSSDLAVMTKMDLAAAVEFDLAAASDNIQRVRPGMRVFKASAKTGAGFGEWLEFLARARGPAIQRSRMTPRREYCSPN
jgi:hydrogenase nickel incorporation protein HypB